MRAEEFGDGYSAATNEIRNSATGMIENVTGPVTNSVTSWGVFKGVWLFILSVLPILSVIYLVAASSRLEEVT